MLLVLRAKEKNIICQQKQGERILVFQRVVPLVSTLMCSTIAHKISHKVRIFPRGKKKKGKKKKERETIKYASHTFSKAQSFLF